MIKLAPDSGIQDLINAFAEDQDGTIHEVYRLHRDSFMRYCQSWSGNSEIYLDCFQEAVIALYENLVSGKVQPGQGSLKTYLFAIGKHKVLNELDRNKRRQKRNQIGSESMTEEYYAHDDSQELKLKSTISQLGQTCKEILIKFYYHQYSIEAIMVEMDYKNVNTVKAHKSRCMKKLREIMRKAS